MRIDLDKEMGGVFAGSKCSAILAKCMFLQDKGIHIWIFLNRQKEVRYIYRNMNIHIEVFECSYIGGC